MVLGIDYDSYAVALAWLPWRSQVATTTRIMLRDLDAAHDLDTPLARAWWAWRCVEPYLHRMRPDIAYLEEPYSVGAATPALYRVQGTLVAVLAAHRLPVEQLRPNEWCTAFLGGLPRPSERKDRIRREVERLLGRTVETQDEADAYGIAWAGRELCRQVSAGRKVGS